MKLKSFGMCSALALTLTAVACEKNAPASPSDLNASTQTTSVTDAVTGITLTSPTALTPTNNQQFKNVEQPVTLTVKNAVTTGTTALTYTFEVATDANFGNRVYTKDNVAEGGGGQTALRIDRIAPDKAYFWRARANSGSQAGPNSAARSFTIGPEVILQTPTLLSPSNNGQASGNPTFVVANVGRSGPVGQVLYRFEISTSNTFSPLALAQTVTEQGGGQTSFTYTVPNNTPAGNYFWRVQASDPANGVTSPFSSTFQFRYQAFDLHQAIILDSPKDFANWAETTKITSIAFSFDAFEVEFDKRDSPDRWRDQPFGSGSLQYSLGMCVNPSGNQWYCSGVVQFWHGRELSASGPPSYVGRNWFYDGRWSPIVGYQPTDGETVGLFVGSGNLRDQTFGAGVCPMVCERSNVQMVTWQNDGFANYTYSVGRTALPSSSTISIKRR